MEFTERDQNKFRARQIDRKSDNWLMSQFATKSNPKMIGKCIIFLLPFYFTKKNVCKIELLPFYVDNVLFPCKSFDMLQ